MNVFVDPYQIQQAIRNGFRTTISVGGNVLFSAGTLSSLRSDISFNNGGGISFGLNAAGVITASVAPGAGAGTGFTTATTPGSNIVGTLGAGGLSMGIPAYLTTAMASNRGSDFVQATANFFGTNASGTISSNAISISVAAPGGGGSLNISAGTTSSNVSAVTFSNGSGVLFGFDGSNITASVRTNYVGTGFSTSATTGSNLVVASVDTNGIQLGLPPWLTTTPLPGAGTGFTTATTAGTDVVGTLSTNGLSMGVPAYLTTAALSQDSSKYAGTGFTTATTAGTDIVGTLATNGLSMGVPAFLTNATAAFPRLDQVLDPNTDKVFNMGTDQVQFQYAGGGTFSTNATRQGLFELDFLGNAGSGAHGLYVLQSVGNQVDLHLVHVQAEDTNVLPFHIEAAHSNAMWINGPINFTTDDTGHTLGSVPFILSTQMSNSVANLNANYVQGKNSAALAGTGFTTATTAGSNIVGTLNPSGLSMGVPAYQTSAGGGNITQTFYQNLPFWPPTNTNWSPYTTSALQVVPFYANQNLTFQYARFSIDARWNDLTTSGTTANSSWVGDAFLTCAVVIYTQDTGTNSSLLKYVTHGSNLWTVETIGTAGATGSNWSLTYNISYPGLAGVATSTQTTRAGTSAQWVIQAADKGTGGPNLTGNAFMDIPMGGSLAPGQYWLAFGISTSSTQTGGPTRLSFGSVGPLVQQVVEVNNAWHPLGAAYSNSVQIQPGLGSYTSANPILSTSSITLPSILDASATSRPIILFQLINS